MMHEKNSRREDLVNAILQTVVQNNSGEGMEAVRFRPSQKFFIGVLSPVRSGNTIEKEKVMTKMSPMSIGMEILVKKNADENATIKIKTSGTFYYRAFPSFEDQSAYASSIPIGSQATLPFAELFRKKGFDNSVTFNIKNLIAETILSEKIVSFSEQCESLWEEAKSQPDFFAPRKGRRDWSSIRMPPDAVSSLDAYQNFIDLEKISVGCPWGYDMIIKTFEIPDGYKISVMLANKMPIITDRILSKCIENSIFESKINIQVTGTELSSYALDYLEKNYKHDRNVSASTNNCSFIRKSATEIETNHVPLFVQKRKVARQMGNLGFDKLCSNPVPVLEDLGKMLEKNKVEFESRYKDSIKNEEEKAEFSKDVNLINSEIERFYEGVSLLKEDKLAMRSFLLMNKTFQKASKFDSWRPFQLVFITSILPDIVAEKFPNVKNKRDHVDVLYFPTGGGKTEAFLGLAVFQSFFDRITGKKYGVSALTKFPLRMLSLDQLNRIATIFFNAELIRRQESDINGNEFSPFSVGYFVGEGITPNKLVDYDELERRYKNKVEEYAQDPEMLEKFHIIASCPICQSPVNIVADPERIRILHVCSNKDCIGELPVYISDDEIYRYLPTFIVGTLDKMAAIGLQINFRSILGAVKYACPNHGFSSSIQCMANKLCNEQLQRIEPHDSTPSLLIQDEMHLVRDFLGTFDSHYESLIDNIVKNLSTTKKSLKIVAATATLSEKTFKDHVEHLYLRPASRFPIALDVFTEEKDEIARLIVGIMPHGKTLINSMEGLMESISRYTQQLIVNEDLSKNEEMTKELRDFWTVVSYHNKKNDAYQLDRSVTTRINENLSRDQMKRLKAKPLTGDVDFKEIRSVMYKIQSESKYCDILDLIIATNIISHGIDIERLNLMTFMGMTPNNAEYIQALSRVGRKSSGLVFVVFNPTRERDRSYFKYFNKFHDLSDLLIESAPIQRWSKKALERTCPGIFSASLYSYFDFMMDDGKRAADKIGKINLLDGFLAALNKGYFSDRDLINFVADCYSNKLVETPKGFLDEVASNVSRHISTLVRSGQNNPREFLGNLFTPRPLTNLRDIEEGVEVALTAQSVSILRKGALLSDHMENRE